MIAAKARTKIRNDSPQITAHHDEGLIAEYETKDVRTGIPGTPPNFQQRQGEKKLDYSALLTPPQKKLDTNILTQSRNYSHRNGRGDVVFRFNCDETWKWIPHNTHAKRNIRLISKVMKSNWKYMFQKSRDMALGMDNFASNLGTAIMEDNNLDSQQSLKQSSAEDVVYIGRIRCDGKLTPNSVYFEGTLDASEGHILSLDLSKLEEYFLFPGQVVAVLGRNNLGKCVVVKDITLPRPLPVLDKEAVDDPDNTEDTGPMTIIIASGPFTPSDSLDFEPIQDIAAMIRDSNADVCILMGPFLPGSNQKLDLCSLHLSFEALFQKQINILSEVASDTNCQLIFVSNHEDVHHEFVYPTPPYNIQKTGCLCVPDPSLVSIGGIVFGLTSTDILMHLSKTELACSTRMSTDRMGRLSSHILSQRNFYPVYPPDESLPLDVEHWTEFAQMSCSPHILVVPSELRYFIKEVNNTIVINPQHATKGHSGGFYCKLQVNPSKHGSDGAGEFAIAEIIKL